MAASYQGANVDKGRNTDTFGRVAGTRARTAEWPLEVKVAVDSMFDDPLAGELSILNVLAPRETERGLGHFGDAHVRDHVGGLTGRFVNVGYERMNDCFTQPSNFMWNPVIVMRGSAP
jgi:hypothetical protein